MSSWLTASLAVWATYWTVQCEPFAEPFTEPFDEGWFDDNPHTIPTPHHPHTLPPIYKSPPEAPHLRAIHSLWKNPMRKDDAT